jgi:20S proteasome alpha/beta subunit
MTLIVGIKCNDGCLVAADTAVTAGNSVYHGDKLHCYRNKDKKYTLIVACSGYLAYARMASQQIRDEVAVLDNPTVSSIKATIKEIIADIYSRLIYPYWQTMRPEASPAFSLIVGIIVEDEFDVVVSEDTAVEEVGTYAFQGSGSELAQYLGETFLRSRGNSVLSVQTAAAVHLVVEILRVAKLPHDRKSHTCSLARRCPATSCSCRRSPACAFCRSHVEFHVQARACGGIHERIEAELIDPALQKCVEPRLSQTETCGRSGLGQSASLNKLLDADHDLRAQQEVACLFLRES